jgi:ATP-dependent RNA helicase DDX18/HAS1
VARAVSNVLKFRTACVTSTSDVDGEQKKLRLGTEILVVTPGRLLALLKRKEISLEKTQALVLDEADVLFLDQSFPLQQIGASCTNATQFIFATATLPDIVTKQIKLEFPNVELIKGPGLHRIAPTIEEVLVDCSSPPSQMRSPSITFEMKKQALFKAFDDVKSDRTLIFCNTIDSCRNVENALSRVDRNQRIRSVYACHGAIDPKVREQSIQSFSKRNLKIPAVMICTDRASRGIDFDQANVRLLW